jgi:hypothetical protein
MAFLQLLGSSGVHARLCFCCHWPFLLILASLAWLSVVAGIPGIASIFAVAGFFPALYSSYTKIQTLISTHINTLTLVYSVPFILFIL